MKPFQTLSLILALMTFGGCSEEPYRDVQADRVREELEAQRQSLQPYTGTYEGALYDRQTGLKKDFRLIIALGGRNYEGDKIPDETASPALRGTAHLPLDEKLSNGYVEFHFPLSDFDSPASRLWLYSEKPSGSAVCNFDGADFVKGTWSNSARGEVGNFELTRVR